MPARENFQAVREELDVWLEEHESSPYPIEIGVRPLRKQLGWERELSPTLIRRTIAHYQQHGWEVEWLQREPFDDVLRFTRKQLQ